MALAPDGRVALFFYRIKWNERRAVPLPTGSTLPKAQTCGSTVESLSPTLPTARAERSRRC